MIINNRNDFNVCVHTFNPNEDKVPNNKERFCLFFKKNLKAPNFSIYDYA